MVKSVYVWNFNKKKVYCITEEKAKFDQSRGLVRIMPKKEAFTWIAAEKARVALEKIDKTENQAISQLAQEASEEEINAIAEAKESMPKPLTPEEEKEELLAILVDNGTVELKGSWYAYEGKNYRKAEILEVIG